MWIDVIIATGINFYIKMFGLFPFVRDKTTGKYTISKIHSNVSNILFCFSIISFPIVTYNFFSELGILDNLFIASVNCIEHFFVFGLAVFGFIQKLTDIRGFLKMLNNFNDVNNRLKDKSPMKNESVLERRLKRVFAMKILLAPIMNLLYIFANVSYVNLDFTFKHYFGFAMRAYTNLMTQMILNMFYGGILIIYFFLVKLNHVVNVLTIDVNNCNNSLAKSCKLSDDIDDLAMIYDFIYKLNKRLNHSFNLLIIFHFTNSFLCIVQQFLFLFYIVYTNLRSDLVSYFNLEDWLLPVTTYIVYFLIDFICFAKICQQITFKSGKTLLFKMSNLEVEKIDQRLEMSVCYF